MLVSGKLKRDRYGQQEDDDAEERIELQLNDIKLLANALKQKTTEVRVRLDADAIDREKLASLRKTLESHPGSCRVALEIKNPGNWTVHLKETGVFVSPSDALLAGLERIFGRKVCELR